MAEPIKWITIKGNHVPIFEEAEGSDSSSDMRKKIEEKVRKHFERYWKDDEDEWLRESDTETMMRYVDKCLEEMEGKEMIQPSADYDDEIVWRFSGKDKETGKHAGFEFDSRPDETNARDNLKGNGYNVSKGLLLPKPLFDYLMDRTDMDDYSIQAVNFIAKQALADYKGKKKR